MSPSSARVAKDKHIAAPDSTIGPDVQRVEQQTRDGHAWSALVVDLHGSSIDVWLESRVVIRKRWQGEAHYC